MQDQALAGYLELDSSDLYNEYKMIFKDLEFHSRSKRQALSRSQEEKEKEKETNFDSQGCTAASGRQLKTSTY